MTAKEQLQRLVGEFSEAEAAVALELLARAGGHGGEDLTHILDGIPGAYESAQRGLDQARRGETTSLDQLPQRS